MNTKSQKTKMLYKYRPIDINTYNTIINKELWFNKFDKLNDPFESLAMWHVKNDAAGKKWIKAKINDVDKQQEALNGLASKDVHILNDHHINNLLICSFSELSDNLLMWGHYADSYKGICLGFEAVESGKDTLKLKLIPNDIVNEHKEIFGCTKKVNYAGEDDNTLYIPAIDLSLDCGVEAITKKSNLWKYEQEHRAIITKSMFLERRNDEYSYLSELISKVDSRKVDIKSLIKKILPVFEPRSIKFDENILKEVIFGVNCSNKDKKTIQLLIENFYPKNQVKFYQCELPKAKHLSEVENREYKIVVKEIT